MAGLLFVFSNTLMRALSQLPAEYGMQAMQRINVEIQNALFLVVFGPFGITMAFNVPLNNRLAGASPMDAATVWPT